ncbi:MAG: rhomboid family intramembrane serine protease [Pyrobaculum sp.]
MAIPIRDVNPTRRFPLVTKGLVFLNIAMFIYQLINPSITYQYAFVPALAWSEPYRWVTHMFLHGGVLHIVGNMVYLWVFGDNVEDYYGRLKFAVLYVAWGLAAAFLYYWSVLAQYAETGVRQLLFTPSLGASGAISGVLGAYLVLYPRARILTLTFFVVITLIEVPAWAYIGFWFLYQLFYGTIELFTLQPSGVAYWAHIGGFLAGLLTALLTPRRRVSYRWAWAQWE